MATAFEQRRLLPVDALVPDPLFTSTHALTIDAPPEQVWPWIAQMGAGRAGWYSGPVNYTGFYNAGGWGPAIVANFPPTIWFLTASVILVRRHDADRRVIERVA